MITAKSSAGAVAVLPQEGGRSVHATAAEPAEQLPRAVRGQQQADGQSQDQQAHVLVARGCADS